MEQILVWLLGKAAEESAQAESNQATAQALLELLKFMRFQLGAHIILFAMTLAILCYITFQIERTNKRVQEHHNA